MTDRPACRARPRPILAVEAFLGEHPGMYRPGELAPALAEDLDLSAVAEVVAYLLASGRVVLDGDGRLVRRPSASPSGRDDPLSGMSANDHPDGVR